MRTDLFIWKHIGGPYGDETSRYDVSLKRPCTVREFVEEVLSNEREWGYIGIYKKGTIFGDPECEYKYGKLITEPLPEEYLNKIVVKCEAGGGWSRMDFLIYVEE